MEANKSPQTNGKYLLYYEIIYVCRRLSRPQTNAGSFRGY